MIISHPWLWGTLNFEERKSRIKEQKERNWKTNLKKNKIDVQRGLGKIPKSKRGSEMSLFLICTYKVLMGLKCTYKVLACYLLEAIFWRFFEIFQKLQKLKILGRKIDLMNVHLEIKMTEWIGPKWTFFENKMSTFFSNVRQKIWENEKNKMNKMNNKTKKGRG